MVASDARAEAHATGMYLYGVVRAGPVSAIESDAVFGGRVSLVETSGLTALTSEVPDDIRVRRRDLRRHLDVLEEAFRETTVLPCRFGTAVSSEGDVRAFLGDRAPELRRGLERLDGCAQLNLKVTYDEEELLREIVAADPDIAALSAASRAEGGAADLRLGQLVAAAIEVEREHDAARIFDAIRPHVVEVTDGEGGAGPADALKTSLLVRTENLPQLEAALEALAGREHRRLRFELIGPLPPTAFAAAAVER